MEMRAMGICAVAMRHEFYSVEGGYKHRVAISIECIVGIEGSEVLLRVGRAPARPAAYATRNPLRVRGRARRLGVRTLNL